MDAEKNAEKKNSNPVALKSNVCAVLLRVKSAVRAGSGNRSIQISGS